MFKASSKFLNGFFAFAENNIIWIQRIEHELRLTVTFRQLCVKAEEAA